MMEKRQSHVSQYSLLKCFIITLLFLEYDGAHNIGNAKYNLKNCI